MSETTTGLVRSYVRGLVWMVPLSVGTTVALWAFDVKGARDLGLGTAVLFGLGFVFVLGPLTWLRWQHWGRHDKPFWIFLGLAMLWALVSLGAVVGIMGALGVD